MPNDISPGKKGPSFFQSLYYVPLKLLLTFYRIIVKWGEVISMWKLGLRRPKSPFDFYSGKHSDAVFFGLFGTRLWTQQLPIIRRGCRIWKFMALPIHRSNPFWKILKIEKVMILQSLRLGSGGEKKSANPRKIRVEIHCFWLFWRPSTRLFPTTSDSKTIWNDKIKQKLMLKFKIFKFWVCNGSF